MLLNNIQIKNSGSLTNAEIELPVQRNYFRISGILNPQNLLSQKENITLTILDRSSGVNTPTQYDCTTTQITPKCILQCDTKIQPIKSTNYDIHLSSGISDINNNLLVIQMKEWENNEDIFETPSSPISNNKVRSKSSGLSKGAIAGIVVACVVVVAAVIILAFTIRKRNPPLQYLNTNSNSVIQADSSLKI